MAHQKKMQRMDRPGKSSMASTGSRPRRYGRWRAATLIGVYVLFALHIAHWKLNGTTLAPLELNEVMHTLELGIVTAGFVLMLAAVVSVAIFGRFFCSWGCHILALEDLCAWILERFGIRPKPVRSRVLLLVPFVVMFYMFIWPQIERVLGGQTAPAFHLTLAGDGWSSFVTSDYWRNLPGPGVALLTFVVCGFVIVYVMGSRSFCTYVCPYGAVFSLADRIAPGRIKLRVNGNCTGCAECTAACESHVRVHHEIMTHGKVVDPACLKDLDCVTVCPEQAITFGMTKPSLFKSFTGVGRHRLRYDFTLAEDVLMVIVFIAVQAALRGLYSALPFFLSLACAAMAAYFVVLLVRLLTRPNVRLVNHQLKLKEKWTTKGSIFAAAVGLMTVGLVHSAFIRYHEWAGDRAFGRMQVYMATHEGNPPASLINETLAHAETCAAWGLIRPAVLDLRLASLRAFENPPDRAVEHYERVIVQRPHDIQSRLRLAEVLTRLGRPAAATMHLQRLLADEKGLIHDVHRRAPVRARANHLLGQFRVEARDLPGALNAFRAALREQPVDTASRTMLAELLAASGSLEAAEAVLREGLSLQPDAGQLHYNLGVILTAGGRDDEAIAAYETASELNRVDADVLNNLGFLLLRNGQTAAAAARLEEAIEINPDAANARFNLGRAYRQLGRTAEGDLQMRRAIKLDSTYEDYAGL